MKTEITDKDRLDWLELRLGGLRSAQRLPLDSPVSGQLITKIGRTTYFRITHRTIREHLDAEMKDNP